MGAYSRLVPSMRMAPVATKCPRLDLQEQFRRKYRCG